MNIIEILTPVCSANRPTLIIIGFLGGRGSVHFQTSVDRRPSKIKVGGFDSDDKVLFTIIKYINKVKFNPGEQYPMQTNYGFDEVLFLHV